MDPPRHTSRALPILRLAALLALAVIGVGTLAEGGPDAAAGMAAHPLRSLGTLLLFPLFAVALWLNMERVAPPGGSPRGPALLLLQTAIAGLFSTELLYVVAIQLPLVLSVRAARLWLAGQVALMLLLGYLLARSGEFVTDEALRGASHGTAMAITLAGAVGWQLLAFAGGLVAATEARAHQEVRRLMGELEATTELLAQSSRMAERVEIARELHDTVGHRLAALGVHFDLAARRNAGEPARAFAEARDSTRELLAEVRGVVGELRAAPPLDFKRALGRLVEATGGVQVELVISPGLAVSDAAQAHALFRCAQEGLTNVLRHAQARHVRLEVRQDAEGITLLLTDDGRGPGAGAASGDGHGLAGMRERLTALGGTLDYGASPGGGFRVAARLPAREGAS